MCVSVCVCHLYIYIISPLRFQKHVAEPFTFFSHNKDCSKLRTETVFGTANLVIITPILQCTLSLGK